jgi:hypothetical protein
VDGVYYESTYTPDVFFMFLICFFTNTLDTYKLTASSNVSST